MIDVDVIVFLEELGMLNVHPRGGEAFYSCPFEGHSNGDTTPSASMNLHSGVWHCFGCGRSGNHVYFLAMLEGVSPVIARRMIRERFGDSADLDPERFSERIRERLRHKPVQSVGRVPEIADEFVEDRLVDWSLAVESLPNVPEPMLYALSRFRRDTLIEWEFGWDTVTGMVCFPYRDRDGRLVGIKGRAWWPDAKPRYKVLGDKFEDDHQKFGFPTLDVGRVVFGAHRIEVPCGRLVVTEGELNAIASHERGFPAVGISGQYMKEEQARIVMSLTDDAVLVYDELAKALDAAKMLSGIRTRIVVGHSSDPAEMDPDELEIAVRNAVSSVSPRLR